MLSLRPVTHRLLHRSYIVFLCLCVPLFTQAAFSQADTATVSGTVVDTTDASIPGASINIENTATGVSLTSNADKKGVFIIVGVRPGHYELSVSKDGFATTKLDDVVLNLGDQKVVQIKLKVGSVSNVVDVNAGGPTINTTDASVGTVVDRNFVENIPLNGRSFQDLISMTPGVVTQSPQAASKIGSKGDFSVDGQRTESNYYTVDGVSGNVNPGNGNAGVGGNGTVGASTALGTTQSLISVDALQEFRVTSSTYSAEYGHSPGGQFSFVTRSGTNTIHGSAFDYLRNNFFDANDWFNDTLGKPIAPLRQNDFGGTLGGPIRLPRIYDGRNKSFFFLSYEGLRLSQPQAASIAYVPDTALRSSAAPVLQPFLNAFPLQNGKEELVPCTAGATSTYPCPAGSPTGTLVQSGLADFVEPYSLPATINSTSVRGDHAFGPKLSIFFRFGDTPSSTSGRTLAQLAHTQINSYSYTFGATSQISGKVTNELRLGYASNDSRILYSFDTFGGAVPINLNAQAGLSSYQNPATSFLLLFSGVGSTSVNEESSSNGVRNWDFIDTTSVLVGHHQLKFGFEYIHLKSLRDNYATAAYPYYFSPGAVQNNQASSLTTQQNTNATPISHSTATFAQDEWTLNGRLTLSMGLRWEVDPAPHDQHGNDAYTVLGSVSNPATLTLAPRGTPLWDTYWYNVAPRLGVAWRAHSERGKETVLRAGLGSFSDTYGEAMFLGFNALGYSASKSFVGSPLPVTPAQLAFAPAVVPPYTTGAIYAFPSKLQVPYTLEWNTSIEQALGTAQTFSLSYVAANGRRLISAQSVSLAKLNPNFGTVYVFPANITSNYQGLQLKFQRTVSRGIQALVSYTWSHAIDYGSTYSTYSATRGNADFDVRQNFSGGVSWEIPTVGHNMVSQVLFGGWGADGRLVIRSGFPITLNGNSQTDPVTGTLYYSGVNLVPGKPLYLYGPQYPGGRALNGGPKVSAANTAFTLPTGTSEGNAPRNFVRGFGANQINLAIRRTFPIKEAISLQFRAETFNLLNHPNFGLVNATLTNALFGQATQMLDQSLATVAPQYQQGGPRSMQFALKLRF